MDIGRLSKVGSTRGIAVAALMLSSVLSACAESPSASSASAVNPSMIRRPDSETAMLAWRRNLLQVPLPRAGCFKAAYPAGTWAPTACAKPPQGQYSIPREHARAPNVVGNGADYAVVTLPLLMTAAYGSFPEVHGVTSVRSKGVASFGGKGISGPNVYSLQLNSNNFSTSACANMPHCVGWEQFVYTNQPQLYDGGGSLIIQDWILSTTSQKLSGCPPNAGWQKAGGDGCYQNAPSAVAVPTIQVSEIGQVSLSGNAAPGGDSAFLAVGAIVYGMKNMQGDGITDLSKHWTGAEFNIVGNSGGARAQFNKGATITVNLEAVTGASTEPICLANGGTTGESNNLSFIAAPSSPSTRRYPSILFTESNAGGGGNASCDAVSAH